jgi:hypothetical protein
LRLQKSLQRQGERDTLRILLYGFLGRGDAAVEESFPLRAFLLSKRAVASEGIGFRPLELGNLEERVASLWTVGVSLDEFAISSDRVLCLPELTDVWAIDSYAK